MIDAVLRAAGQVSEPRFFQTERGFQGRLAGLLQGEEGCGIWPGDGVVEQEYQKRMAEHGITYRPDIIIHRPTPKRGDRREGNYLVILLKCRASSRKAREDFDRLDEILAALNYDVGLFVNIDSHYTRAEHYGGPNSEQLHFAAVWLDEGRVVVRHEYYDGTKLVSELRRPGGSAAETNGI